MSSQVRSCSLCPQVDDEPRCVHHVGETLEDDRWTSSHFACCAAAGCVYAKGQIGEPVQVPAGANLDRNGN